MQASRHRICTIWLLLVSLISACEWTPSAGPVKPERLARGEFLVRGMIDNTGSRFAWVTRREDDRNRHFIFDLKSRTSCELPERTTPLASPLAPPAKNKDVVFLWPLLRQGADLEDSVVFADERCRLSEFSTSEGTTVFPFVLRDAQGTALLVSNQRGRLSFVDPWREQENLIATGVGRFAERRVSTSDTAPGPQALWMIEGGALKLRELDGTLRVTIADNVTEFTQGAYAQLRIAFVADGNLYEAVEPRYQPVPLASDACTPSYGGTLLSFASPCAEGQLNRIDLTTGEREPIAPGVVAQWESRGFVFERQRADGGAFDLYVTPPDAERTLVEPYLGNVQLLDANTLAGRDADGNFGVWTLDTRRFLPILKGVPANGIIPFVDSRTSALLWLVQHDVKDAIGTLSVLEQSGLQFTEIASKVPVYGSGGYAVASLQQVPEPILMVLRNAKPFAFDAEGVPARFRGTLEVRLVSGALPVKLDSNVSSYGVVYDIEAGGLLYAVDEGERQGLWFAAL